MEDGVYLPCGRKSEFVCGGREDLFNFKGAISFRGELLGLVMEFKVLVIEPDLISDFPGSEAGVYVVLH